jgi:chemosensory pili system protein ChpA (sensor histidine kinase/response regulator)
MTTQLVDLHASLSGLWQELQDTDLTSLECWRDLAIALQFSAVPGLQYLGSELYNSLRRDTAGKLFKPGPELTAIAEHTYRALGAAFEGQAFPAAALVAINSLRINTQQNLFSANHWAAEITPASVDTLSEAEREKLAAWLVKAAQLFKLALMQLLKGEEDGLPALQKLLPRLAQVTESFASAPMWKNAAQFVICLAPGSAGRALPQLLLRYLLQNLTVIAKAAAPEAEKGQSDILARQLKVYANSVETTTDWLVMSPDAHFDASVQALHALQGALLDFFEDGSEFEVLTSVPKHAHHLADCLKNAGLEACSDYASTVANYVEQQVLTRKLLPSAERIDQLTRVIIAIEWALRLAAWRLPWTSALEGADRSHQRLAEAVAENLPATAPVVSQPSNEFSGSEIDPELRDIFVEEAREVLQDMLSTLADTPLSHDALAEIRRGFHTIKGSGRMVGAEAIGAFGWSLENTYNQVLQSSQVLNIDHAALIGAAVAELTIMVDALAQGQGDSLTTKAQRLNVLLIQQTSHAPPSAEEWRQAIASNEDTLSDVFAQEATQYLDTVSAFVKQATSLGGNVEVPNDVLRAMHSLKGGAKTAKLLQLSQLIEPLEAKLKLAHKIDSEAIELLANTEQMARHCLLNEHDPSELDALHARIAAWDIAQSEAVENAMASLLAVGETLDSMYPAMLSRDLAFDWHGHAEQLLNDITPLAQNQPSLAELLHAMADFILRHIAAKNVLAHLEPALGEAFDALNLIAADQSPEIKRAILESLSEQLDSDEPTLEDSRQDVDSPLAKSFTEAMPTPLLESPDVSEPVPVPSEEITPGKPEPTEALDEVDQELIDIFGEEAQELIEAIDGALAQWQQQPSAVQPAAELKRYLHTLKGGARMVDWREMASLAHTMETDIVALKGLPSGEQFRAWRTQWQALDDLLQGHTKAEEDDTAVAAVATSNNQVPKAIDLLKVPVDTLEEMANIGGEISISRSQLDEQRRAMLKVIQELESAQQRTTDQLRRLDTQTQAQIAYRREQLETTADESFDPLEMDRYTQLQQLTNGLMESLSDIGDLKSSAFDLLRNMETTLVQQGRMSASLIQKLHQSRMIPVARLMPRLRRLVDQISLELGKPVEFSAAQIEGELQRSVLERIATSLEHIVRNALDHGIESVQRRLSIGKPEMGSIKLSVQRRDNELVFVMSDDGAGINRDAVLKKAIARGIVSAHDVLSPADILRLIMRPGFSTAKHVTEISGRGVGMDVVDNEMLSLGGRVEVQSIVDHGTEFTLVVPFSQSVNRALMVDIGRQRFAVPFAGIEGIMRISRRELVALRENKDSRLSYGKQHYHFCELSQLLGIDDDNHTPQEGYSPLILIRSVDGNFAVRVDALRGSRELVVKSLGPQFGKLMGIAGATIMGDGNVISILDLPPLLRAWQQGLRFVRLEENASTCHEQQATIMIVDDSITVRKITSRLLERHQFNVMSAKDGVDGLEKLDTQTPDIILLDVEMPRMDGFEFASQVRHSPQWQNIPIVMVSSRSGEKHRRRAAEVGVDHLLSKPYREEVLLEMINELLLHGRQSEVEHG